MEPIEFPHPHWEAVTHETREVFRVIAQLDWIDRFYLAGGTGLALHLGHRFSVDLDLFSQEDDAVGPGERADLREILEDPTLEISFDKDTTFVAYWRGAGIGFFRLQQYPLVKPTLVLDDVHVASIEEIGAMKLAAIIDRGARKDFVDLYFILQQTNIERLFEVAAVKYASVRSFAVSATRALSYFEDAEAVPMPKMLDRTPWAKMRRFLEHQAMQVGRKHLEDLWG